MKATKSKIERLIESEFRVKDTGDELYLNRVVTRRLLRELRKIRKDIETIGREKDLMRIAREQGSPYDDEGQYTKDLDAQLTLKQRDEIILNRILQAIRGLASREGVELREERLEVVKERKRRPTLARTLLPHELRKGA